MTDVKLKSPGADRLRFHLLYTGWDMREENMSMICARVAEEENKTNADKLPNEFPVDGNGLSSSEVRKRLQQYGYNEIREEKANPVLKFLGYFWGPIPWMIEVAAVLSALVRHWEDLGIILALLVMNGIVGFWEEYQADNTIAALKAKLALKARVKRDGLWTGIPARELVPGDLIRLRIGEIVPADAKLLEGQRAMRLYLYLIQLSGELTK